MAQYRVRGLRNVAIVVGVTAIASALISAPAASAHNAAETSNVGIQPGDIMAPSGSSDDSYNGYKVFLSSPRHSDSGSRGECRSPGNEENVNGRNANWFAANGNYIGDNYSPTLPSRNLHGRGYQVYVSKNARDDGYLGNRTTSQNWGSNIHIVTHSNASGGCDSNSNYLYTAYNQSNDSNLASRLGTALNSDVPGTYRKVSRTDLAELNTNASNGDAYVELQFHDNQTTQSWLYRPFVNSMWDYGVAVDNHLGYP